MRLVAINLGRAPAAPASLPGTPATRVTRPGWRDPRLWIGVVIIAVSVLAGARLLGAGDDSVQVWAVAHDEAAGVSLGPDDLVAHRVRFDDGGAGAYFLATDALPADMTLDRPVTAGELLPRAAVGPRARLAQLPLSVDPAAVPPSVGPGSTVDVYVEASTPVLTAVAVLGVTPAGPRGAPPPRLHRGHPGGPAGAGVGVLLGGGAPHRPTDHAGGALRVR
jgi:hypothetical protein